MKKGTGFFGKAAGPLLFGRAGTREGLETHPFIKRDNITSMYSQPSASMAVSQADAPTAVLLTIGDSDDSPSLRKFGRRLLAVPADGRSFDSMDLSLFVYIPLQQNLTG
jgi:hypothetical protein